MYSHPLLNDWPLRRPTRLRSKRERPGGGKARGRRDVASPRRTLDEKLDQALEFTFPASDAFVIG
jgi:hypothetical protein